MGRHAALQAQKDHVGHRIRQARKQAYLTHDALADKVGSSRQHLIKLESGQHMPGNALLERIAEATGRTTDWFFADEDDEESSQPVAAEAEFLEALRPLAQLLSRNTGTGLFV